MTAWETVLVLQMRYDLQEIGPMDLMYHNEAIP
jgi:hypothetical protein